MQGLETVFLFLSFMGFIGRCYFMSFKTGFIAAVINGNITAKVPILFTSRSNLCM